MILITQVTCKLVPEDSVINKVLAKLAHSVSPRATDPLSVFSLVPTNP